MVAVLRGTMACWALALALGAGFWFPRWRSWSRDESRLQALRSRMGSSSGSAQAWKSYEAALKAAERLERKLGGKAGQSQLLAQVQALAGRSGLRLVQETFSPEEREEGRRVLAQDLVLSGRYPGLRAFLAGLGSLDSLTLVRLCRIQEEAGGLLRAELSLVTYGQDEEKP